MGNQVVVSFLTDHWNEVEKDPERFVKGISAALNYGSDSLSHRVLNARRGRPRDWPLDSYGEARFLHHHYVTVHRYQHADVPQITWTGRNSSYDLWDFSQGLEDGYLDQVSNPEAYVRIGRGIVDDLRYHADRLERILDERESKEDS